MLSKRLGAAAAITLLPAACAGGDIAVTQDLAVRSGVYARDNTMMCPPDKPRFVNGACTETCKTGYHMLGSGECRENTCQPGDEQFGSMCYKNKVEGKISDATSECKNCMKLTCQEKILSCNAANLQRLTFKPDFPDVTIGVSCKEVCMKYGRIPACCKCDNKYTISIEKGSCHVIGCTGDKVTCYENNKSYRTKKGAYSPEKSGLKINCAKVDITVCGEFDGLEHCIVREGTNGKRCAWNLPGYPYCVINGNTATCYDENGSE